jgi:hypothetical protein
VAITRNRLVNRALIALLCSMSVAQETARSGSTPLQAIIQSMQKAQAATLRKAAYQVFREYRLFGATNSKANSEVVAEVNFRPRAFKDYRIQKPSGSSRRQQLVRQVLDQEVEATTNKASSAINTDNYNFDYIGEAVLDGQACYILSLKPKRKETDLISGEVWIDKHSFFVRQIEGELEKSPSWWLKQVLIKVLFADFQGSWVQTRMEARADVRIVGTHTLTSRLVDYRREDQLAATRSPRSAVLESGTK